MALPSASDVLREKEHGLYSPGEHDPRGFGGVPIPLQGKLRDLIRVPSTHAWEIYKNGELWRSIALPINHSSIKITRPSPADLHFTFGGVIRENTAHRVLNIEIMGRSGLEFRPGYDRQGDIIFADGPTLLREFDAFLDVYQSLTAKGRGSKPERFRSRRAEYELVFRDFDRKLHVKVEPVLWSRESNAKTARFSETYALNLLAYGPAGAVVPENLLWPVSDAALLAAAGINALNAYLALGQNAVVNVRNDMDVLLAPFQAVENTGRIFQNIAQGVGSIVAFPKTLVAQVSRTLGAFRNAWDSVKDVGDIWSSGLASANVPDEDVSLSSGQRELYRETEAAIIETLVISGILGAGPRVFEGAERRGDQFVEVVPVSSELEAGEVTRGQLVDVVRYRWQFGDSAEAVSLLFYNDVESWMEVVNFNGFLGPETQGDGSPLRAGSLVLLPNTGFGEVEARSEDTTHTPSAFGVDLLLDDSGDLVANGDGSSLLTVTGVPNLEQALVLRLTTTQGDSAYFPAYGLPIRPGDVITGETFATITALVREQFARDPRVKRLDKFNLLLDGGTVGVEFEILAIHQEQPTRISAPLPVE